MWFARIEEFLAKTWVLASPAFELEAFAEDRRHLSIGDLRGSHKQKWNTFSSESLLQRIFRVRPAPSSEFTGKWGC